jgi:predicted adenylyl cyclase CyaB
MVNIEIKARCSDPDRIREILKSRNARFVGLDHQIDTYFKVEVGKRLKLRHGNIENSLIFYEREDVQGPKKSEIILINDPPPSLRDLLSKALGILAVVDKEREIYFIENVKFHIDRVKSLSEAFVEIEAIDEDSNIGEAKLLEQCKYYLSLFGLSENQLVAGSYSDLLLASQLS